MKTLYLFLSFKDKNIFIGELSSSSAHGKEIFAFEFSKDYLSNKKNPLIDPSLLPYSGKQYDINFINDMIPDRFGSLLIDKQEQLLAIKVKRVPKKLTISNYLLRVNDLSRMGALRIKEDINGPFVNENKDSIPPYIYLRDIENASIQLEENVNLKEEVYRRLLMPGSSLGGARPKANVYLDDDVYLAKFPSKKDDYDVELWEYVVNKIAEELGLNVPKTKIEKLSNHGHTFLANRFDRDKGKRIHYISAITALRTTDGNTPAFTYYDLVNFINTNCINIKDNLLELYKRMIFTYLINNTDNHLRNHAFIVTKDGLSLSPMFDVNPSFYIADFELSFPCNESREGFIGVAKYFYINENDATKIYDTFKKKIIDMIGIYTSIYPEIKNEADILIEIVKSKN